MSAVMLRADGRPMTPRGIELRNAAARRAAREAAEAASRAIQSATDDRERAYALSVALTRLRETGAIPEGAPDRVLNHLILSLCAITFPRTGTPT